MEEDTIKKTVNLRIEELLLEQQDVDLDTVERYMRKYSDDEYVESIGATYCVHTGKYLVHDGTHRLAAKYLLNASSIWADVDVCFLWGCKGVESDCTMYNVRHLELVHYNGSDDE